MNDETTDSREKIEDMLLFTAQELSEKAYEKFIAGEVSQCEFQELNTMLSKWIDNGKKLIEFVS